MPTNDLHTWVNGKMISKAINKPPHGKVIIKTRTDTCACGALRISKYSFMSTGNFKYYKDGVFYPTDRPPACGEDRVVRPKAPLSNKGHIWKLGSWEFGTVPYRTKESKGTKAGYFRIATCDNGCPLIRIDRKYMRHGPKHCCYAQDGQRVTIVPPCEPK